MAEIEQIIDGVSVFLRHAYSAGLSLFTLCDALKSVWRVLEKA